MNEPLTSYLLTGYLATASLTALFYLGWGAQHLVALRKQVRRFSALPEPDEWPDVTLLVPAKGDSDPNFESNVRAFLGQRYPGKLTTVFCFESDADPAAISIERLTDGWSGAQKCIAGIATRCGQKNHNLLAGVDAHGDAEVYLIADVDILPGVSWVRDMVKEMAHDESLQATTGFYYRIPAKGFGSVGDHFSALVVAWIGTGMARDAMAGLWGGSLAVRGTFLRDPSVRQRLERSVVDDMCLREELMTRGLRRAFAPTCVVPSYVDSDLSGALAWAVRQGQYTQLHDPALVAATWATLGPAVVTLALLPVVAVTAVITGDWFSLGVLLGVLVTWLAVGATFWGATPRRDPALPQLRRAAFILLTPLAFVLSGGILLGMVIHSNRKMLKMRWRDVVYEVDRSDGSVVAIVRPEQRDTST